MAEMDGRRTFVVTIGDNLMLEPNGFDGVVPWCDGGSRHDYECW